MSNKSLTIICCLFNEYNILEKNFKHCIEEINNETFYEEIIFIDNNSNDGTKEYLSNYEKKNNNKKIKFIFNNKNLGKGGSIKKAIRYSIGNTAVIYDLDEYNLSDIKRGFEIFLNKKLNFLIGSRILKKKNFIYKKNYYGVIFLTKIINILYNLELTDSASATKFFSLNDKSLFNTFTNGFNFEFELISNFAKKKLTFDEYEIDYEPRTFQEGKKIRAFQDGIKILLTILLKKIL